MADSTKWIKCPGDYNIYTQYTLDEFWKKHRKEYPFSGKEMRAFMRRFAERVHEELLSNPNGMKLDKLGTLIISGNENDIKDHSRSTDDKVIYHRNIKTNKVIYTAHYIFGKTRGGTVLSFLWRFKTTVPLRQKIKKRIDEGNFRHWFVFNRMNDVKRLGVPVEYRRESRESIIKNANKK